MKPAETVKLVVFAIDQLNLALPIQQVRKIINHTTVYNSGLSYVGVTIINGQQTPVVDLHYKLFNQRRSSSQQNYLIVVQNQTGEQFGIILANSPTILDIALENIRVLPDSYRDSDILAIASYVTIIPQQLNPLTVFILDLEKIII